MLGEPSSVTRDAPERTSDQLQYPGNYVVTLILQIYLIGITCTT